MRRAWRSASVPGPLAWALALLLYCSAPGAPAAVLALDAAPAGPLGRLSSILVDGTGTLGPQEALALQRAGAFAASRDTVPKFGIGAPPVWLHLAVRNTTDEALERRLMLGMAWVDRLDVYLIHDGAIVRQWTAGDGDPAFAPPHGGMGYVMSHAFPPGDSEILIRAATPDPLVLPLRILSPEAASARMRQHDYGYGLLYGFLLALAGYNAMLYAGLRERSHLDYALYLGSFVLLSLAYSGHGYTWLWAGQSGLQAYVILALMVLFGIAGLRFADRFLGLALASPRTARAIRAFSASGAAAMALCVALQWQVAAATLAFVFVLLFNILMVGLGVFCVRRGQPAAYYFLAGTLFAMAGAATTTLAVWFALPFSDRWFHAAELGVAIEGTLLALALAYRMRRIQSAHEVAEQLSRTDPLTGLLNRRAFLEQAAAAWSTAQRRARPLSVIVLDLDHFKALNDRYGHLAGDKALEAVATVLQDSCRRGDLAARWGGEEFIVLLPETDSAQAHALAERLLGGIRTVSLSEGGRTMHLSASLGVAERAAHDTLETLIRDADGRMYRAKQAGRAQVCSAPAMG